MREFDHGLADSILERYQGTVKGDSGDRVRVGMGHHRIEVASTRAAREKKTHGYEIGSRDASLIKKRNAATDAGAAKIAWNVNRLTVHGERKRLVSRENCKLFRGRDPIT